MRAACIDVVVGTACTNCRGAGTLPEIAGFHKMARWLAAKRLSVNTNVESYLKP